jgi:DNA-binding transcriptional ArsR family regulator
LADPARLRLLNALRAGERSVSDLVEETGLSQANVSKHLGVLHASGFVGRRKEGLFTFYALSDTGVFKLCDLVCERIEAETEGRARILVGEDQKLG